MLNLDRLFERKSERIAKITSVKSKVLAKAQAKKDKVVERANSRISQATENFEEQKAKAQEQYDNEEKIAVGEYARDGAIDVYRSLIRDHQRLQSRGVILESNKKLQTIDAKTLSDAKTLISLQEREAQLSDTEKSMKSLLESYLPKEVKETVELLKTQVSSTPAEVSSYISVYNNGVAVITPLRDKGNSLIDNLERRLNSLVEDSKEVTISLPHGKVISKTRGVIESGTESVRVTSSVNKCNDFLVYHLKVSDSVYTPRDILERVITSLTERISSGTEDLSHKIQVIPSEIAQHFISSDIVESIREQMPTTRISVSLSEAAKMLNYKNAETYGVRTVKRRISEGTLKTDEKGNVLVDSLNAYSQKQPRQLEEVREQVVEKVERQQIEPQDRKQKILYRLAQYGENLSGGELAEVLERDTHNIPQLIRKIGGTVGKPGKDRSLVSKEQVRDYLRDKRVYANGQIR